MKKFFFCLFSILFLNTWSVSAHAASYDIDLDHSSVQFKIHHLLSNVRGNFDQVSGTFDFEPGKPETWKVEAAIQTASINTKVPERDKHLKSPDFFDAEKYPTILFKSTKVTIVDEQHAKLEGLFSMHGIEKNVTLDLEIHGVAKDPWGNVRAAFTATTTLNRKDFGIVYNQTLETGNLLIGEDVEVSLEIEGILKEAA